MLNITDFRQDSWLRAKDLRDHFSISPATLNRWVVSGKIPPPEYLNSIRVWSSSAIKKAEEAMLANPDRKLGKRDASWAVHQ